MIGKKIITSALILGIYSLSHANLVFSESFDYTASSSITDNGWSSFSANGATATATVGSGLSFGTGNVLTVSGGAADVSFASNGGGFTNAGFQTADFGGSFTINTGTLWRSYLFQTTDVDAISSSGRGIDSNILRYDVAADAGGNANRIPGSTDSDAEERKFTLNAKNFGGSGVVGHWAHDNGVSGATNALSINTTYLLVSSYDFASKDNTIWVFDETTGQALLDAAVSGPITSADLDSAVASGFTVTQTDGVAAVTLDETDSLIINFATNGADITSSAIFDEFKIGTDLNDVLAVTAVPEPSTYAMILGLMGLGLVIVRKRRQS